MLISIPNARMPLHVAAHQIIRLEALSNYSRVYFANGRNMVVAKTLGWFQQQLPADLFVRVHRSHVVNRTYVKEITGGFGKQLVLNSGDSILVSRRKRNLIRAIA